MCTCVGQLLVSGTAGDSTLRLAAAATAHRRRRLCPQPSKPAEKPAEKSAPAPAAASSSKSDTAPAAAGAGAPAAAGAAKGAADAGLDKTIQAAVSRAAQLAAEDVIARGGTKEQANAAGAKAAQAVLNAAKSGKSLPQGANVTPTIQAQVSKAAEKAARDVIAKGGTQAQANAAGAAAAKKILEQYSFTG